MSLFQQPTDSSTIAPGTAGEACWAATMLELLSTAEAAVERDRQMAHLCLARAAALLRAERDREGVTPVGAMRSRSGMTRWQVKILVDYINANLDGQIGSAELVALAQVSAGHFFRTFKATFGEAPCAYIARRRIERAQELMLATSQPLCQIALDCGLCDQSHLTRLFRRIVGMTPRAWRREHAHDLRI